MINDIGNRIKFAREYRNLSTRQLADLCNKIDASITYNGMWQWEVGRRIPKADVLSIIASVLKVQVQYFLPREHFNDPVEKISPYLIDEEQIESDILASKDLKNKESKISYISHSIKQLSSKQLDTLIEQINILKKHR
ncbi:MAG: helix-turn-helix transcriptional regulator [Solobacterium sp.]|nr:helix-turn-helix transcriptional regulator [Solobacterium sp.]